jgi:retron-type reverse transcriptase
MQRVISNKSSHGVDGMTVYELKQFLKANWMQIREVLSRLKPMPLIQRINKINQINPG